MHLVFLSYSHADVTTADCIRETLEARGLDVWQDSRDLKLGDNWIRQRDIALKNCSAFLLLASQDSLKRNWVNEEIDIAYQRCVDEEREIGKDKKLSFIQVLMHGVAPNDLPERLRRIQLIHLTAKPTSDEYQRIAKQIYEKIVYRGIPQSGPCPFAGLAAFDEDNADFFFGRAGEIKEAADFFSQSGNGIRRWLQIDGPSGVGKSSLVKAGIIPRLRKKDSDVLAQDSLRQWLIAIMRPGYDPVLNLAEALTRAFKDSIDVPSLRSINVNLQGETPTALRDLVRQYLPEKHRFLLVLDQLEEVFTQTRDDESRQRLDSLVATALEDRDGRFYLITTIRSDFTIRLCCLPNLESLLNAHAKRFYLKPMGKEGLYEAIDLPMHLAGLEWEERTLRERIIEEAVDRCNALPLLSNLMLLLWQWRFENRLQTSVYDALGRMGGALVCSLDEVLDGLGSSDVQRAKDLLLRLVKISPDSLPTRRTISRTIALQAAGGDAEAERILNRLSGGTEQETTADSLRARPIVISEREPREGESEPKRYDVDLAHEALITDWPTLRGWINDHREQMMALDDLENVAISWEKAQKPQYPGIPSRRMRRHYRSAHSPSERAQEYLRSVRRQILRRIFITNLMVVMIMSALIFSGWISVTGITIRSGFYLMLAKTGIYFLQPEMVTVPAGQFIMGSPEPGSIKSSSESDSCGMIRQGYPEHKVVLHKAFQIGIYEVTFDEYEIFARLNDNVQIPNDYGWGRGRRPVIGVNWEDAVAYAQWLSKQTGKSYHLPTEAQWEYAARAKSTTAYWWGSKMEAGMANCWDCGNPSRDVDIDHRTTPVGSFPANSFGLYDTAGNVMEWVQDCWHLPETGEHHDASAWEKAGCKLRVFRGGSWESDRCEVQSATRKQASSDTRFSSGGFRLAR